MGNAAQEDGVVTHQRFTTLPQNMQQALPGHRVLQRGIRCRVDPKLCLAIPPMQIKLNFTAAQGNRPVSVAKLPLFEKDETRRRTVDKACETQPPIQSVRAYSIPHWGEGVTYTHNALHGARILKPVA